MKSNLIFLSLLIAFSYSSELRSQTLYLPAGTGGIGVSSNENIGIGTTSVPTEKLEVAGYIKAGHVSLGGKSFTESSKNYVNLSVDGHGTLLLSSNLYLNNSRLYIANTHSTMAGAAIKIPGNGQDRQGYVEFWTSPPGSVTSGADFAQGSPRMVINTSGNLGIGTINPSTKLEVAGSNNGTSNNSWINLDVESISNPKIYSKGWNANFDFYTYTVNGSSNLGQLHLNSSGNVGIGTISPGNYKLNVAGSIRANEIVVNTTGADFVFEPTYKLRTLSELETFIRTNKHLPDIAPAKEMQEHGVSAGEMQAKLLQKVEELTLYVIEQEKKNEMLNLKVMELQGKIDKIESKTN